MKSTSDGTPALPVSQNGGFLLYTWSILNNDSLKRTQLYRRASFYFLS